MGSTTGTKTIEDYKKDYADALARNDPVGMAAANKGANDIRESMGLAKEDASGAVAVVQKRQNEAILAQGKGPLATVGSGTKPTTQAGTDKGFQLYETPQAPSLAETEYVAQLQEQDRRAQAAQKEAALAKLKSAYSKTMSELDAQADKLPARYQAAMNSAATQSAMAKKAFDERAAASGLNSGASGQAALDASAAYQGNLSNLRQAKAQDQADIDRSKATLRAQYELAIAQAEAEGDLALAEALKESLVLGTKWAREDEQTAYDREQAALDRKQQEREYQDKKDATEYEKKLQAAETMAAFGDFRGYAELWGLDEATVNAMVTEYARQKQISEQQAGRDLADWYAQYGDFSKLQGLGVNTSVLEKKQALALTGKTSGGGGDNSKKPGKTLTYQDIYDAGARSEGDAYNLLVNAGYSSTEAKATAEYFMDYLDEHPGGGSPPGVSMAPATYQGLTQMAKTMIAQGDRNGALMLVNANLERMSEAQADELMGLLGLA